MSSDTPAPPERYIGTAQLLAMIPLTRQHILKLEKLDDFPHRIHLGVRRVAWRYADVQAWLDERHALAAGARAAASTRGKEIRAARTSPHSI